jgi:predicted transcriptional regulator of viral defense system
MLDTLPNGFTYDLAHERGLSDRRLRGYLDGEVLERLGHGVYRKADAPPADLERIEIALRAPEATLGLKAALSLHDLTDAIPAVIDVAPPRSKRPPRVSAPVRWHRFQEDTFDVGRETMDVDDGSPRGSTALSGASSMRFCSATRRARNSPSRR